MSHAGESSGTVVKASPSKDPAVRMLIVAAMALGFGLYCVYHAYIDSDPESIAKYRELAPDADINAKATYWFNLIGGYVLPLVGLLFLSLSVRQLCRTLSMDDSGIHSGSETVAWSDIREVNAEDLKKDILYVFHSGGKLKIDGYLWQKSDFQKLVALLEQRVPAEKIKR